MFSIFKRPEPKPRLIYKPKEDIAVYELARVVELVIAERQYPSAAQELFETFPVEVRRHFELSEGLSPRSKVE